MIRELFTDDTVWVQPGLPTATGADEAIAIVKTWGQAFSNYELEVRHVASTTTRCSSNASRRSATRDGSSTSGCPSSAWRSSATGRSRSGREYYDSAAIPGLRS